MKKNAISMLLILCATLQAGPIPDGSLDPSFGTGGIVTTDIAGDLDAARAVLFQPDGKIIAVGQAADSMGNSDFALVRYNSNGSLDISFDTDGIVITNVAGGTDIANAALLQPDGKIIAVGDTGTDFALVRYNSDGSLDTLFGIGGIVTTDLGGTTDFAFATVLQPDGKIIVVGRADNDFALTRYNSNGSLDVLFGAGGIVITSLTGGIDAAQAVLLQPDGKIIAVGVAGANFGLARYNSNGSLDTSFGTGGIVITDFAGGSDNARAAALQPNGKIIAAGQAGANFGLARYNSNGSLDTSFGTGGIVTTVFAGVNDNARAIILQPDGKIVAVGIAFIGGINNFALARYNSNGSLDTSFGTAGKVTTKITTGVNDSALGTILQSDGKIIAVGQAATGVASNFGLARYLVPSLEISQLAKDFRSKYYLLLNPNYSH